jgi:hypothetical protein
MGSGREPESERTRIKIQVEVWTNNQERFTKACKVRKDANKNSSGSLDKQPGKVHKGMQTVEIKNAFLVEKDSHPIIKQLD